MRSSDWISPKPSSACSASSDSRASATSSRGTVNDMSARWPSDCGSFWMIMSTLMFASASAVSTRPAMPGTSGSPVRVIRASAVEWVTAVMSARSIVCSSSWITVPGPSSKLDRQWIVTPWLRAYSTERSWSTPGAARRHLEHLLEGEHRQLARLGHDARVGAEHAGHVRVDLADVGAERGGERDGGRVRAAAAERGHVERLLRDALEAGHQHDLAVVEPAPDAVRLHLDDARLRVAAVGDDARLRARERDRLVAEVVDHHRRERAGHALAGREQHVHLARVGAVGDLVGERDELVRVLPARGEHRHHARPRLLRAARCARRRA